MQSKTDQLDQVMLQMFIANMDIAESHSPPRVTQMARSMGLRAGWSVDLTTTDPDGQAWDFNNITMRNKAVRNVLEDKQLLLI